MTSERKCQGFTLAEMLVSVVIFALLILFVSRLFNSAAAVTTAGNKHLDCDLQARQLFNRIAVDIAQMVKRPDVDYYVKSPVGSPTGSPLSGQTGNDQIAFFTGVPGYYPSTGSQSAASLVAYRINSTSTSAAFNRMERMGKGLLWNGVSPSSTPVVFLPVTIGNSWPSANNNSTDSDYETIGPQIFRFEYFYFLRDGSVSDTPWDVAAGHFGPAGMQDVAAICTCIAVVDPKSKVLLSNSQITTLAGRMNDFSTSMRPGDLIAQWQSALDGTNDMPRPTISAVRLYQRSFHLLPKF